MKRVQFQINPIIMETISMTANIHIIEETTFFQRETTESQPQNSKQESKESKENDYTDEDIPVLKITIQNTFYNSIPTEKMDIKQRVSMFTNSKRDCESKKYISAIGSVEEIEQHASPEFSELLCMIHKLDREIRRKSYTMFSDVFFKDSGNWESYHDWFHRRYSDLNSDSDEEDDGDFDGEYDEDADWLE
jgi:hypothetical protein